MSFRRLQGREDAWRTSVETARRIWEQEVQPLTHEQRNPFREKLITAARELLHYSPRVLKYAFREEPNLVRAIPVARRIAEEIGD